MAGTRSRAGPIGSGRFAPTGSLWTPPQPWTPRTHPPLLGKRPERVSHSAHRRRHSSESGQITCQTEADRSLVNNRSVVRSFQRRPRGRQAQKGRASESTGYFTYFLNISVDTSPAYTLPLAS